MRGDIPGFMDTVEPRFNEPLYNEVLGITKDFPNPTYTTTVFIRLTALGAY